jgi:hypothetical protein
MSFSARLKTTPRAGRTGVRKTIESFSGELVKIHYLIPTVIAAGLLTACGGGGGGTAPAPNAPTVAISTANGKAVAAIALDNTTNPFHLMGVTGLLATLTNNPTPSLFTATQNCTNGGTVVVSGTLAGLSVGQVFAGDQLRAIYSNCAALASLGSSVVFNGAVNASITGASTTKVAFNSTLSNFSVATGSKSWQFSGDQVSDWDTGTPSSLVYKTTGTSLTVKTTAASVARTNVWKSYVQTMFAAPNDTSYTFFAALQTDNSNVVAGNGLLTLSTISPVTRNNLTGALTSGSVKIVGAGGSNLLITVTGSNVVSLQLDANGDGIYETSVTVTSAELLTLL